MAVLAAVLPAGIRAEAAVSDFASSISSRRVGIASLRDAALSRNSRYRFLQGSCTDGTYGYFLLGDRNYRNSCAVVKIRLSDWRIKKVRTGLPLHHGNDMTYNKKTKRLMVLHGAGDAAGVTLLNPNTLRTAGTLQLDQRVYGIAYNAERDAYAAGISGKEHVVIKNAQYETVREFDIKAPGGYTHQGMDCDSSYIYFLQSRLSASKNRILVYTWDGAYVTQITMSGRREGECLFHTGKKWVIAFNDAYYSGGGMLETALRRYYQVRYQANGGSGRIEAKMVKNGSSVKLAGKKFKRKGYSFAGWKLKRASDGKVLYRGNASGKLRWLSESGDTSGYELYLAPAGKRVSSLTDRAGDCITCTAQWTEK